MRGVGAESDGVEDELPRIRSNSSKLQSRILLTSASSATLITRKVIARHNPAQPRLHLKSIKTIPRPLRYAQIPIHYCAVLLSNEPFRLLIQEEAVPMRPTARRRSRWPEVHDRGRPFRGECAGARGVGAEVGLDPMEYGAEDGEGNKGPVEVEAHR